MSEEAPLVSIGIPALFPHIFIVAHSSFNITFRSPTYESCL